MNVKFLLGGAFLLLSTMGWAAPQPNGQQTQSAQVARPPQGEELNNAIRQLRTGLTDLKHELQNHDTEIRMYENKLHTQELSFDQLRQELTDQIQSQRDFARASSINLESKTEALNQSLTNLEGMMRGVMSDLRQMKIQSNDSVTVLGQYKQKITELETLLQGQTQHMQNLDAALQSMMEVWQAKESAKESMTPSKESLSDSGNTYKVQPGDSLEKIARLHKVSVQALRDANQLTNDRILIGQTLKIP